MTGRQRWDERRLSGSTDFCAETGVLGSQELIASLAETPLSLLLRPPWRLLKEVRHGLLQLPREPAVALTSGTLIDPGPIVPKRELFAAPDP